MYSMQEQNQKTAGMIVGGPQRSLAERLEYQKRDLEERLAHINDALSLLRGNPEVAKLVEALQKVSGML